MPTQTIRAASSRLAAAVVMTPAAAAGLVEKMWRGQWRSEFFQRAAALTLQADFRVMRAKRFARDAKIEVRRQHMVSHWGSSSAGASRHPASDLRNWRQGPRAHLYYTTSSTCGGSSSSGGSGRLPKWQDLPSEAKVPLGELRRSYGGWGLPILALSYPWPRSTTPTPRARSCSSCCPCSRRCRRCSTSARPC